MPRFIAFVAAIALAGSLLLAALTVSPERPTAIALSRTGDYAAVGTASGSIYLVDPADVSKAQRVDLQTDEVTSIALVGDAIWAATSRNELVNLDRRGRVRTRTPLPLYGIEWMTASATTLFLAEDYGERIAYFSLPLTDDDVPQFVKLGRELRSVCRTGEQIYWSDSASRLYRVELSASPQTAPTGIAANGVSALDVNERGDAVFGDEDGDISRFDLFTNATVWSKPGWSPSNQAQWVSIDENGDTIVALSEEGKIVHMDAHTGNILDATQTGYVHLAAAAIAEDNSRVAVISEHHRFGMREVIFYDLSAKTGAVFETNRSFSGLFWFTCFTALASLAVIVTLYVRGVRRRREISHELK